MRGRMGLGLVLIAAAMLLVACASPAQREEKKQREQEKKMAQAEAKRQKEVAAMDAKHQQEEAKRQEAEAKRMAEADRRQRELDAKQAEKERKELAAQDKQDKEAVGTDVMMRPEKEVRSIDRFLLREAAAGAREDAMLSDEHFEGTKLNSLGRGKLNLIGRAVPKGSTAPIIVYVNSSDNKVQSDRVTAVQDYWKISQYGELALTVKNGFNDNVTGPAQPNINALSKIREGENNAASGAAAGSPGMAPSAKP